MSQYQESQLDHEIIILKKGRHGRLSPSVVRVRGVAVKQYNVWGWRGFLARRIVSRESRATAELARAGVAPITLCPFGLFPISDLRLCLGTAWIPGQHPDANVQPHVAQAILDTLEKIHAKGWTHNDLHRSNILFEDDGQQVSVWILDWASAARPIWPFASYLRARDRRHVERVLGLRSGPKPLSSRLWRRIKQLLYPSPAVS